jgi:hypothetical protein
METVVGGEQNWTFTADPSRDGLVATLTALDGGYAQFLADLDVYDRSADWAIAGYYSLRDWLVQVGRRTSGEANLAVKMMRLLRELPVTREAFRSGVLAKGHVQVLVANLTPKTVSLFADVEAEMIPALAVLPIKDSVGVMAKWAARAKEALGDDGSPPDDDADNLHLSPMMDNRWKLDGAFTGENGKIVEAAIGLYKPVYNELEAVRTNSQRQADALVELCRAALEHFERRNKKITPRQAADFTMIINFHDYVTGGIAQYADGTIVTPDRVKQFLCNAVITPMVVGAAGQVMWLGHSHRTASAGQWRALIARDRHCAFPGCRRPPSWTEAHHVEEVERDNGPTDITNMCLLCNHHHKLLHSKDWSARMGSDQILEVTSPGGITRRGPPRTPTRTTA